MNFNKHLDLEGRHAFLSASKYHWLNYTDEKLASVYANEQAKALGTELHDFARRAIEHGIMLADETSTLSLYVNDCIRDSMSPEVVLYYSMNAFGTADAISFNEVNQELRIYDLKTGKTPASIKQLYIYTAYFCLEYDVNPADISIVLRIYQKGAYIEDSPSADTICDVMDKIIVSDSIIHSLQQSGGVHGYH